MYLSTMSTQQLVIVGTDGGKAANALLRADAAFSKTSILAQDQQSREAVLTELAVASGRGDVRILVGGDAALTKVDG